MSPVACGGVPDPHSKHRDFPNPGKEQTHALLKLWRQTQGQVQVNPLLVGYPPMRTTRCVFRQRPGYRRTSPGDTGEHRLNAVPGTTASVMSVNCADSDT